MSNKTFSAKGHRTARSTIRMTPKVKKRLKYLVANLWPKSKIKDQDPNLQKERINEYALGDQSLYYGLTSEADIIQFLINKAYNMNILRHGKGPFPEQLANLDTLIQYHQEKIATLLREKDHIDEINWLNKSERAEFEALKAQYRVDHD